MRALALAFCIAAAPALAQDGPKASFDCKKASTPVERAICQGNYTAELDGAMDELYRAVLAKSEPAQRAQVEAAQRQWLNQRNTACGRAKPDIECIARLYKQRIVALARANRGGDAKTPFISGQYAYREKAQAGEMFLAEMPDNIVLVVIETANVGHVSPHTCSFSERLKAGPVLQFRDPAASKTCALEIAVTGNRAVMREAPKDCFEVAQFYCGAHGYMLGNYLRQ